MPKLNEAEWESDVSAQVKEDLHVQFVDSMEEVFDSVFGERRSFVPLRAKSADVPELLDRRRNVTIDERRMPTNVRDDEEPLDRDESGPQVPASE